MRKTTKEDEIEKASPPKATSQRVSPELHRVPLDGVVRALFGVSWGRARAFVESGKVFIDDAPATDATFRPREGALVELRMAAQRPRRRGDLGADALVFVDAHVVVVAKPAGLSTVPFDERETDTLDARVRRLLAKKGGGRPNLGVVHRIDKETSGLVVFTRTWLAKEALSAQFRAHTTHRRYLAIVHGVLSAQTFVSHLIEDRGDGLRGSLEKLRARGRDRPGVSGRRAVTHVEPREALRGATLVECRLETGRTHQLRIHLSEAGHPIVGERVYIRDYAGPLIEAPRLLLHAAELGFVHPATEAPMRWTVAPPDDFARSLAKLR